MKILKLNLQYLHLDEIIAGNTGLKEYVLRTYLNAVEAFIEAGYTKDGAELLQELVNEGWFLGSRNLVYTKFIDIANKIVALDQTQTAILCAIAKKLKLKVYTNDNIVSIGKEIKVLSNLDEEEVYTLQDSELITPVEIIENIDVSEIVDEEITEDVLVVNNTENQEIIIENTVVEELNQTEVIELTENMEISNIEENTNTEAEIEETNSEEVVSENEEPQQAEDEDFMKLINQFNQEDGGENNKQEELKIEEKTEDADTTIEIEETKIEKEDTPVEEKDETTTNIVENIENTQEDIKEEDEHNKITISNILNITHTDIDKHFEKIKDITTLATQKAEQIKDKVEKMDIANSKSVEKIKDVAKKISAFKWKK